MVDAFEDLELALRLADQRLAGIGVGSGDNGADADAPAHGVHPGVRGFPVEIDGCTRRQRYSPTADWISCPAFLAARCSTDPPAAPISSIG
jgi:hypothetical protein